MVSEAISVNSAAVSRTLPAGQIAGWLLLGAAVLAFPAFANAYLVCFEEAANGDYQDYVFTLRNVKPVAP